MAPKKAQAAGKSVRVMSKSEIATYFDVSQNAVLRWINEGCSMKGESETTREKAPIIIGAAKLDDKRTQLIKIGTRRAKDLADRMIRNESPGPFHLHIPQSASAIDTDDGRPKVFDSLLAEKKVVAAGIETWKRKSKMNTGEVWDCFVGNIAVAELALLQWRKVIARILTDMTPQAAARSP